jgi:hypothetical protein
VEICHCKTCADRLHVIIVIRNCNCNCLFTCFLSHKICIFTHMHSVHFTAFFMHYPVCTTPPGKTRKCRPLQRHFRDVTLATVRITDITLSRINLSKCTLLQRYFRDVTITPVKVTNIKPSRITLGKCRLLQRDVTLTPAARITDITLWRKCLAPVAMLCPGFCTRSLQRRSKRQKKVKHFRTINTVRSLPG